MRNLKSEKFSLDYFRRCNSTHMKSTKQKHSKVNRMWAERECCMSVQPFIIQPYTSITVAIPMSFDILLALPLFYVHRIHYNRAIRFPKIMVPFLRNKHCQWDKGICSHGTGSSVHASHAKKTGQHWTNWVTKLGWGKPTERCRFANHIIQPV